MNALAKIEDIIHKPITKIDLNNVGIKELLVIIYAGLYHEDKNLTVEKVGDIIDEYSNITTEAEKIGEAFTLAFGKDDIKAETKGE